MAALNSLLIEDEPETARYISNGLTESGYAVTCSDNGAQGLELAQSGNWDLIIVDRLLPGGVDGLSIVSKLRELGRRTPMLIVSAVSSTEERVRGLRQGGDDYISKPFAFSELLARIEALLRRAKSSDGGSQLRVADLTLDLHTLQVRRGASAIPLQPRELRLLAYLMRNEGQVVTRSMLLEAVWDCHFDPQTNVIDVQMSRLRSKVDKGFSPALIHTIRGVGYVLGERAAPASGSS
jgi:two-component system, OmpR family, response regulator